MKLEMVAVKPLVMETVDTSSVDLTELVEKLTKAVASRSLLVIFCRCDIEYRGRSRSILPEGDRLVIVKTNHSVIVHRPTGYSPVNWQPESSMISFNIAEDEGVRKLVMTSVRESPREYLWLKMSRIYYAVSVDGLSDDAKFSMYVSEKEVKDYLVRNPHLIENGLKIIAREYRTKVGIVDLMAVDREGNLVAIEVKDEKASIEAAKQLLRYVKQLEAEKGRRVRGILVAPGITSAASEYLKSNGLEKVLYDPVKMMDEYLRTINDPSGHSFPRSKKLTEFF